MALLEALNLKKYYGKGSYLVKAVDDISFGIDEGEFVAVVGTSGSGKTTLLNLLGGLDTADSGKVVIRGKSLLELGDEERTVFRRRNIGFVFQNYNLLPEADVYQNIILPIRLDGSKNVDEEYVTGLIEKLGLGDKLRVRPNQLSGGQQQRVAIARALSTKPAIVLADEPTGNLDSETSGQVMELLQRTLKDLGQTMVMITHNEAVAAEADRLLHIKDGKLIRE
ncbi:MAG: ABC transporter ATP-binding protein [Lachnospiraceae bacterium]|nr:ABC transporter ATP-binding protein [Lachnospiraceae bacterium]